MKITKAKRRRHATRRRHTRRSPRHRTYRRRRLNVARRTMRGGNDIPEFPSFDQLKQVAPPVTPYKDTSILEFASASLSKGSNDSQVSKPQDSSTKSVHFGDTAPLGAPQALAPSSQQPSSTFAKQNGFDSVQSAVDRLLV